MWVEMIVGISGGRADGSEWPLPGFGEHSMLEVSDVEGRDLVQHGLARPCRGPETRGGLPGEERAVITAPEEHAVAAPGLAVRDEIRPGGNAVPEGAPLHAETVSGTTVRAAQTAARASSPAAKPARPATPKSGPAKK